MAESDGSTRKESRAISLLTELPRSVDIGRSEEHCASQHPLDKMLYLSRHTVRNHLRSIFKKLGVNSQEELSGSREAPDDRAATKEGLQLRANAPSASARLIDVEQLEVVVAHSERATLRVGDVFVKIDSDQARTDVEVAAMGMVPIPTPEILWRMPPVLALAALPGTALGHLGDPSPASSAAWVAAGAAIRTLHDSPLPPWPGRKLDEITSHLDRECEWLIAHEILPIDVITRNRQLADAVLRPWVPVFIHGDLQVDHVFVAGDVVTGVIDWSEAAPGDALFDLATLTVGHPEHLEDVIAGYGTDVDLDLIRAWWSLRCLSNVRWLNEHGYGNFDDFPEVAVLRRR